MANSNGRFTFARYAAAELNSGEKKIAFNTSHFGAMLASRITGGAQDDGMRRGVMMLGHFNLGEFLSSPGLWIGLAVTAAFLGLAVRLRRYRAPI